MNKLHTNKELFIPALDALADCYNSAFNDYHHLAACHNPTLRPYATAAAQDEALVQQALIDGINAGGYALPGLVNGNCDGYRSRRHGRIIYGWKNSVQIFIEHAKDVGGDREIVTLNYPLSRPDENLTKIARRYAKALEAAIRARNANSQTQAHLAGVAAYWRRALYASTITLAAVEHDWSGGKGTLDEVMPETLDTSLLHISYGSHKGFTFVTEDGDDLMEELETAVEAQSVIRPL